MRIHEMIWNQVATMHMFIHVCRCTPLRAWRMHMHTHTHTHTNKQSSDIVDEHDMCLFETHQRTHDGTVESIMHTHTHSLTHVYIHTHTHIHIYIYIYTYTCTRTHTHTFSLITGAHTGHLPLWDVLTPSQRPCGTAPKPAARAAGGSWAIGYVNVCVCMLVCGWWASFNI
jgi:hypothetical protein